MDTSFLIELVSKPIRCLDLLEVNLGKVEFLVPTVVVNELRGIARSSSVKKAKRAMLALDALANNESRFKVVDLCKEYGVKGDNVDDIIIECAFHARCYVATMDSILINRLKAKGVRVVTLKDDLVIVI